MPCLLILWWLISLCLPSTVHANLHMRSLLLIEPEKGLPDRLFLSSKHYNLTLSSGLESEAGVFANLDSDTNSISLNCKEAIVMLVRSNALLELCSPWTESSTPVKTISGIRPKDFLVISLIEDRTISPRISKTLAKLPRDLKDNGRNISNIRRVILDATAEGKLIRTLVLRFEETNKEGKQPAEAL